MWERAEKRLLSLILILFVLLGFTYAVVTPPFEASDELWHYPMVRHLADGNPLPVQVFDPALAGPWQQQASQPPLYYYLGAALTFWIDQSDMSAVRRENPHVDNGIITSDGNTNLVVHTPDTNPWVGALLAVRVVRFFSLLLGAATVYLTFRIAKEVAPNRPEITLGATAVTAFLPMFLFISGAINNDNLIVPLAALALFLMIRIVRRYSLNIVHWLLLGVAIGLAALAKISGVGLLLLAWGTAFITCWQTSDGQVTLPALLRWLGQATLRWLLVLLPALLIAGWWYYRNVILYDDWRGWSAFIAVLGERQQPASLAQLWAERQGFMMAYWGLFGGVNVPMAAWIYQLLNSALLLSVAGFVLFVIKEMRSWRLQIEANFQSLISTLLNLVVRYFPLVICFLWATAIVIGLIDWATTTWSSQGRLVFSALPALSTLMMVGLVGWLPPQPARWVAGGLAGFMLVVSAAAPFLWIRPAYQPPADAPRLSQRVDVDFSGQMRLVGYEVGATAVQSGGFATDYHGLSRIAYEVGATAVQPGDALWLALEWEVVAAMDRDWSVFVHLNDPVLGRPIAQRDMYLGQGLLPTTFLQPGARLVNRYHLQIPKTAVAPAELELTVGLYDYYTCPACQRLPITGGQETVLDVASNAAMLERISLTAVPGDYPNPTEVNFGNRLELAGFELLPRRGRPGETVHLTLHWRAKRPLTTDYTFFAQALGDDNTRWAAQDLPGEPPTSTWIPGQVYAISMNLTLNDDTPPEVYPLIIGVYTISAEGQFERLQVITPDGRPTDNFWQLTLLRVDE